LSRDAFQQQSTKERIANRFFGANRDRQAQGDPKPVLYPSSLVRKSQPSVATFEERPDSSFFEPH
jgi:hypothetical protein